MPLVELAHSTGTDLKMWYIRGVERAGAPVSPESNCLFQFQMTTAQRMEKQFFLQFISLINEVQGKQKLPSQLHFNRKSSWMKQVSNPRQKKDALALV